MATYSISNFLATPSSTDTTMRIYDKSNKLIYTIDPNISYFYTKINIVTIKVDGENNINLDFESAIESSQALSELNTVKNQMVEVPFGSYPLTPIADRVVYVETASTVEPIDTDLDVTTYSFGSTDSTDSTDSSYLVSNFLATPSDTDTTMRIYNSVNKLIYTIDPNRSYFLYQSNIVIIRTTDKVDILLSFPNNEEASEALIRLNYVRNLLIGPSYPPVPEIVETGWSKANLNMSAEITVNDSDLACNTAILDTPIRASFVKVFINGVEVNVGGTVYPYDCYFSSDGGTTVKILGDEKIGDKLYWNYSVANYNLDVVDLIDFHYLIDTLLI
jgi:hypothetical protein